MARESFGSFVGRQALGLAINIPSGYLMVDAIAQTTPPINPNLRMPEDIDLLGFINHSTHMPPQLFAPLLSASFIVGGVGFFLGSQISRPRF